MICASNSCKKNLCTVNGYYNDTLKGKYLNRLKSNASHQGEKDDALTKEIKHDKVTRMLCQIKQITSGEKVNALTNLTW